MGRSNQVTDLGFDADRIVRGMNSEERVRKALEALQDSGEIFKYYKTEKEGELDKVGIDFQVYPEHDWLINLQVKSSVIGKEAHVEEYGESIPCVVVHDSLDDRQLVEEVRRILSLSIEAITKRH